MTQDELEVLGGIFISLMLIVTIGVWGLAWIRSRKPAAAAAPDPAADVPTARENIRLARENEDLRLTIDRLEERLAVLERIATDPAERTAREIENLR